jgi:hypothetical protein
MSDLIHLIYASAATRALAPQELATILGTSRRNNDDANVTGMLLHADGSFFQVLEGSASVVDALYKRIEADSRHVQTTCIIREIISVRAFDAWTMGFAEFTSEQAADLVGGNDFYSAQHCLQSMTPGRSRKLLEAFAIGRWHTQLRAAVPGAADTRAAALH